MNSSAGCQVSAATCGAVALVWGRLYGCIGLSWTVLSHTSRECSDISLDEGLGGEDRGEWLGMLADALRTGGVGPSSTLWRNGNPWKVKRELVFNFVC